MQNNIHYDKIKSKLKRKYFIYEKNYIALYKDKEHYYKIWSADWDRSNIAKQALNNGLYNNLISYPL